MKKQLLTLLMGVAAVSAVNNSNAQTLIYSWNFNGADSSVHTPNHTAAGAGSATYNYWCAYTDYKNPGSSVNLQSGDTVGSCIRFRNPSDSVVFKMPTTGYKNVIFSYAATRTQSGATHNVVRYTTDGTHYTSVANADLTTTDSATYTLDTVGTDAIVGWSLHTFSFSGDTMTNNNPNFAVSITFVEGPDSTSGNDRFDNVVLKGTALTPPSAVATLANAAPAYALFPNPVANMLTINSNVASLKSYSIYNASGEKVAEGSAAGILFTVNTGNLSAGNYYINIRENGSGNASTIKFVK